MLVAVACVAWSGGSVAEACWSGQSAAGGRSPAATGFVVRCEVAADVMTVADGDPLVAPAATPAVAKVVRRTSPPRGERHLPHASGSSTPRLAGRMSALEASCPPAAVNLQRLCRLLL